MLIRSITVVVDQVLFSDSNLPLTVGSTVQITSSGDGTNTGAAINDNLSDRWNHIDGDFASGTQSVLLLDATMFPYQTGTEKAVVLTQWRNANWTIEGGSAVSTVPGRTVPVASLLNRITLERSRGFVPESYSAQQATSINRLA